MKKKKKEEKKKEKKKEISINTITHPVSSNHKTQTHNKAIRPAVIDIKHTHINMNITRRSNKCLKRSH